MRPRRKTSDSSGSSAGGGQADGAADAVAAAYVRSVADRRRARLAREADDASASSGGKGHKAGGTRTHRGKDGEDAAKSRFLGLSEEEKKAIRKEEKEENLASQDVPNLPRPGMQCNARTKEL